MLLDHFAVYITLMISAVVCPLVYSTQFLLCSAPNVKEILFLIDKGWSFKPLSYENCCDLSVRFFNIWWENTKVGDKFQKGDDPRMKLQYRGKEVLINQVFDSAHKERIEIIRKTITPIVDTVKQCVSKYSTKRSLGNRTSDLTNSGNPVELLQHRVDGVYKNLENYRHNTL